MEGLLKLVEKCNAYILNGEDESDIIEHTVILAECYQKLGNYPFSLEILTLIVASIERDGLHLPDGVYVRIIECFYRNHESLQEFDTAVAYAQYLADDHEKHILTLAAAYMNNKEYAKSYEAFMKIPEKYRTLESAALLVTLYLYLCRLDKVQEFCDSTRARITFPDHVIEETMCIACYRIATNMQRCGVCELVMYCDRKCQKNNWKSHKLVCKAGGKKYIRDVE